MLLRTALFVVVLAALASVSGLATTYVVRPDGSGDYPTIQDAIEAADDGDIIELTDGTFTGDGNRNIDYMGKGITVRSQTGDPGTCIIDCEGSEAEPHRGFVFQSGEGSESALVEVTVANAYFPSETAPGGAVLCEGSSPTISGCVFTENTAGAFGRGGVACFNSSSPRIEDCTFSANVAEDRGGGIGCRFESSPIVDHCVFVDNLSDRGGGIYYAGECEPQIKDCVFRNNTGTSLGGGCVSWWAGGTITNCTFEGNEAEYGGGAAVVDVPPAEFQNCTFYGNTGIWGSGLYVLGSQAVLSNTIIAFGEVGSTVFCEDMTGDPILDCCNLFGNAGGDWVDCVAGQDGINGNISEDPLFCDPENGDFTIRSDSPCAPFSPPNEECDLIGAWPMGCGPPTATQETTWGRIKAMFHE
jgi:hypothetical protein